MISYEYSKDLSYNRVPGDRVYPVTTAMLTGADFLAGAPTHLHNGARAYIMDWKELDSDIRDTIGSQILIYDKEGKRWLAQ